MDEEDIILIEEVHENQPVRGIPIFGVYQEPDGTINFATTLNGPEELLYMLDKIRTQVWENYIG